LQIPLLRQIDDSSRHILFSVLCPALQVKDATLFYNTTPIPDGSYLYPTSVFIKCPSNTLLDGPTYLDCLEDGNWNYNVTICEGKHMYFIFSNTVCLTVGGYLAVPLLKMNCFHFSSKGKMEITCIPHFILIIENIDGDANQLLLLTGKVVTAFSINV
jgi:hypothetical protein